MSSEQKIEDAELNARERGPAIPPSPPIGELPAGGAQWPVPHYLSKISIINQVARAYRWTHDEALRHSRTNAVAMLRDVEIREALETRFVPVVQLEWHLAARDPTDPKQLDAVKKLEGVIRDTPHLQDLFKSLLWAVWYGRAGVQLLWEWDFSHPDGEKRLRVRKHKPINGDSLVARWSDDWGLLVNGSYPDEKESTDRGWAHFFTPREMEATLVHMHNPEDADFYEGELAGKIRGTGVRDGVYWSWWLAANFMALAEDYGERFANGLWKAYYDESNPSAKTDMESSLAAYKNSNVIFLPRSKATMNAVNDTVIEQVNTANPAFLFEIVQYLRQKIRNYITGNSIGLDNDVNAGGDAISMGEDNLSKTTKYDAERLAETLTEQWMPVLTKYNCGDSVPPPIFVFNHSRPNAEIIMRHAQALMEMGSSVNLQFLHEITGIPMGSNSGGDVATKLQNFQPLPATETPQGIPSTGSGVAQDQQSTSQPSPPTQPPSPSPQTQQSVQMKRSDKPLKYATIHYNNPEFMKWIQQITKYKGRIHQPSSEIDLTSSKIFADWLADNEDWRHWLFRNAANPESDKHGVVNWKRSDGIEVPALSPRVYEENSDGIQRVLRHEVEHEKIDGTPRTSVTFKIPVVTKKPLVWLSNDMPVEKEGRSTWRHNIYTILTPEEYQKMREEASISGIHFPEPPASHKPAE